MFAIQSSENSAENATFPLRVSTTPVENVLRSDEAPSLPVGNLILREIALNSARLKRLVSLASLLENGGAWSGNRLAEYFHACRRTIFRDIQMLRNANVPVVFDARKNGYRISRDKDCNCPKMKADEVVALVLAVKFVGPLPETIAGPCAAALTKVLAAAPPDVRQRAIVVLEQYVERGEESITPRGSELRQSG